MIRTVRNIAIFLIVAGICGGLAFHLSRSSPGKASAPAQVMARPRAGTTMAPRRPR